MATKPYNIYRISFYTYNMDLSEIQFLSSITSLMETLKLYRGPQGDYLDRNFKKDGDYTHLTFTKLSEMGDTESLLEYGLYEYGLENIPYQLDIIGREEISNYFTKLA